MNKVKKKKTFLLQSIFLGADIFTVFWQCSSALFYF